MLVLNQNYEPMLVCNARRALVMLFLNRAEMVEPSDLRVCAVRRSMPLPSVVRLSRYIHRPRQEVKLTRQNILRRDHYTCQYCATTHGSMTADHVVPRSQGGEDTWENLVCACMACNNKKGDHSLYQARMTLQKKPRKPQYITFLQYSIKTPDQRWKPYLFLSHH